VARVEITPTLVTRDGVADPVAVLGTADGNSFANTGIAYVRAENLNLSSTRTITFILPQVIDGETVNPRSETIPAASTRTFGPFPTDLYNQADGTVWVDEDAAAPADISLQVYTL